MNSTITFLNLELADYRKDGASLISPNPNIRKSQYLAFQNSSNIDKSYKLDPNRFSPLKRQNSDMSDITPMKDIPRPMLKEDFLTETNEFHSNLVISPDELEDFDN